MAASIASNSISLFKSATAQPGWTKLTTFNDYMLRVVDGIVSTVGANPFTSVFSTAPVTGTVALNGTVSDVTLAADQIIQHTHPVAGQYLSLTGTRVSTTTPNSPSALQTGTTSPSNNSSGPTGGGLAHSHSLSNVPISFTGTSLNFSVKYVDVIVAQRN